MRLLVALIAALSVGVPAAYADAVPFADDGQPAWAAGNEVVSPLEAALSDWSSRMVGHSVSFRCLSQQEWMSLFADYGADPTGVFGVTPWLGNAPVGWAAAPPSVCDALQRFALAQVMPTKCDITHDETRLEDQQVSIFKTVVQPVRRTRHGRWVWVRETHRRVVNVTKQVPMTVSVASPSACYASGNRQLGNVSADFWTSYDDHALGLQVVTHETTHLAGVADEQIAECHGLQQIQQLAAFLGDTADDGAAIGAYYFAHWFEGRGHDDGYWSDECRDGGSLDLNATSSPWP